MAVVVGGACYLEARHMHSHANAHARVHESMCILEKPGMHIICYTHVTTVDQNYTYAAHSLKKVHR